MISKNEKQDIHISTQDYHWESELLKDAYSVFTHSAARGLPLLHYS